MTTATVGLGVAGPAFASDVIEPMSLAPPAPVMAEPLATPDVPAEATTPLPAVPTLEEPPVVEVVTQTEAGNIDVSVRVLSPGTDAAVVQESTPVDVVSALPELDITPDPAPAATMQSETSTTQSGGVNTNVSIRVLSPGDNGPVSQSNASAQDDDLVPVSEAPSSTVPDRAPASSSDAGNSPQYQESNSQYQSENATDAEPWNWEWVLSKDCGGNTSSISTESGGSESLIWSWDWSWNWDCGAEEVSASAPAVSSSTAPTDPPSSTATTGSTAVSDETGAPWDWVWNFTFCGDTTTIPTQAGAGTPLTWTWDWTWDWTCSGSATDTDAAPAANESVAGEITNGAAGGLGALIQSLPLPLAPVVIVELPNVSVAATQSAPMPTLPLEISVDVAIPAVVSPGSVSLSLPSSIVVGAVETTVSSRSVPRVTAVAGRHERRSPGAWTLPPPLEHSAPKSAPGADHPRATKTHHAKASSPRRTRTPAAPFDIPRRHAGLGSSSSGGVAPSALLIGVAALTGFVVLAAPGLGRRIRVARELSPRSPDRSPLDHPG